MSCPERKLMHIIQRKICLNMRPVLLPFVIIPFVIIRNNICLGVSKRCAEIKRNVSLISIMASK